MDERDNNLKAVEQHPTTLDRQDAAPAHQSTEVRVTQKNPSPTSEHVQCLYFFMSQCS